MVKVRDLSQEGTGKWRGVRRKTKKRRGRSFFLVAVTWLVGVFAVFARRSRDCLDRDKVRFFVVGRGLVNMHLSRKISKMD